MKKKLVIGISAIILALALLCGCGTKDEVNNNMSDNQQAEENVVINNSGEVPEENIVEDEELPAENSGDVALENSESGDTVNEEVVPEIDNNKNAEDTEISDNWLDMEFVFDGLKYKIGETSYNDLKNAGWTFDLADYGRPNGYILNPGDKSFSTVDLRNSKYGDGYKAFCITVGFVNNDTVAKDITECDIWSVKTDTRYGFKLKDSYSDMTIAKGIKYGSSEADVLAAFGTPTETYENPEHGYKTFTWRHDFSKYLKITVYADGGVSAIELQQYKF